MPELPEVEALKMALKPKILMKTIKSVAVNNAAPIVTDAEGSMKDLVIDKVIVDVDRRGKYLVLTLSNEAKIIFSFALFGNVTLQAEERSNFYDFKLSLCDGSAISFIDTRHFAKVYFISPHAFGVTCVLDKLGVEPLTQEFTPELLQTLMKRILKL